MGDYRETFYIAVLLYVFMVLSSEKLKGYFYFGKKFWDTQSKDIMLNETSQTQKGILFETTYIKYLKYSDS